MKFLYALFRVIPGLLPFCVAHADGSPVAGCYEPVSGFAASICKDETCSMQEGIFFIELKNPPHKVRISGTFTGYITGSQNACGGATLSHVFKDKINRGAIFTEEDIACPIGGDGVTTLEVRQTLNLKSGTGIYAGLQEGGSIVLEGKLGLTTGINTFKLVKGEGEVCFEEE